MIPTDPNGKILFYWGSHTEEEKCAKKPVVLSPCAIAETIFLRFGWAEYIPDLLR
jgi:hypothetical protein